MKWRPRQILPLCTLLALLGAVSTPVASNNQAKAPAGTLIAVRFSKDCVSAVVESAQQVKSMVAVFNDGRWEQMDGLPTIASYTIKVGPNASESGLAMAAIYVDAHSRLQKDPLGIVPHDVGIGFECNPSAERVQTGLKKRRQLN